LAGRGFYPNPSAVSFDNLFADRQSHPGAGVLCARVQALKDHEYSVEILGLDPDAIIANGKKPLALTPLCRDGDL